MKEQLRKIVREIMREQCISEINEESVNEAASKEAMGIAALTGTRGSAVEEFINKHELDGGKLFRSIKKANLRGRLNFVSALAGKDGNPNQKLTIKLHKKNESVVNEIQYDDAFAKFNKELENNSEIKKAAKHYKKSVKDIVKVLQSKIKVNRYSDKSIKQISINYTEDGPLSSKVTIKASQNYKQNESVNEGKYDGMLDVIEDLVSKAKSFMDVGNQLKKHKVKYSFSTSMIPMYKLDKLPIVIVNKKYVDKADREVGDIAIGLMESINESLINESPSSEELRIVMMAVRKIAKYRNVPIDQSINDVLNAVEQLKRDIKKGKIKK
jgi:hypothetical protein